MARQTILVYLPDEDRVKGLLDAATAIARRSESHLIGVYAVPPLIVHPMSGMELPAAVYDGHLQGYRDQANEIEKTFNQVTQGGEFVAEWRVLESGARSITDTLMDHVRCADMVIAPHYNAEESDGPYDQVCEDLAIDSGRPVLMVPNRKKIDHIGEEIVIGWDGSRECVRAVFDAVEVLQQAKTVRIVTIGKEAQVGPQARLPAAEIAATLSRRGVNCIVDQVVPGDLTIGDALLARIGDHGSDLLIMGMYGHSKLREFVFGGVTRKVLQQMTIPVMMSR